MDTAATVPCVVPILSTRLPRARPGVAGIPARVGAYPVTAVLGLQLDALFRLHRLGVKAERDALIRLSACLGGVLVTLARQPAGTAS